MNLVKVKTANFFTYRKLVAREKTKIKVFSKVLSLRNVELGR